MGSNPPMRKFEHEIKEREIISAVLNRCPFIVISADDGGVPYSVPVCFGSVASEEELRIYVHTAREGRKVELWNRQPVVSGVGAYLYNNMDPERYYRESFHDYRSVMFTGRIERVPRGVPGSRHGEAVQAMLRNYDRRPNHFSVPHYGWMDVYCIHCRWEDVSAKAEGPMSDMKYVRFPEKDEPAVTDPNEYEWFFCRKFFEEPPSARPAEQEDPADNTPLPRRIAARSVIVETAWDDGIGAGHADCDAFPFLLDGEGRIRRRYDLVFYNQPKTFRTDGAEFFGDDAAGVCGREEYRLDLDVLAGQYPRIALMASVYDGHRTGTDLAAAQDLRIRVKDAEGGEALAVLRPSSERAGKFCMQMAELELREGEWFLIDRERTFDRWMIPEIFAEYGLESWRE